jgi:hypothetical protein
MKSPPRAVAARQRERGGVADMADAERIDETVERDLPPRANGGKQVAHRRLAVAFLFLQSDFPIALLQRKNIGRLLEPFVLEKQLDLLFAQPVDIEGAPRHEML